MGHDSVSRGMNPDQVGRSEWIETFRSRSRRDLRAGWRRSGAAQAGFFLDESWGARHRPDWAKRGLLIWPRGRQWLRLEQQLSWPDGWSASDFCSARLVLSWWAEQMRLWVDGVLVHEGDLFDTACRWPLPEADVVRHSRADQPDDSCRGNPSGAAVDYPADGDRAIAATLRTASRHHLLVLHLIVSQIIKISFI